MCDSSFRRFGSLGLVRRLLCCLLGGISLLLGVSCSAPRPYYADYLFKPPRLVETDRSDMVLVLDWYLQQGRVRRLEVQTPQSGLQVIFPRTADSPNIDWMPLPVLYAAQFILDPRHKGLEVDLLAHTESDGLVPISARHDTDGNILLSMGRPRASLLPPQGQLLSPKQLQELYGIGSVQDGSRAWLPYELYSLERALALLSPEERAAAAGTRFIRDARAASGTKRLKPEEIWGEYDGYYADGAQRAIRLFNTEEGHDTSLFIGEPDDPHPGPTMCLLHEIGHTIADEPRFRIDQECRQQIHALRALGREWKALSAADQLTEERARDLEERLATLQQARKEHDVRHRALRRLYKKEQGPVLAEYLVVRGPARGPTKYGRTDLEESFAESFALFRADPAALRRIYPDVFTWFATGGHIRAMHRDPTSSEAVAARGTP